MSVCVATIKSGLESFGTRDIGNQLPTAANYNTGYEALLKLFRDNLNRERLAVHSCAYAVYGWMPTILKRLPDEKEISQIWGLINAAKNNKSNLELSKWHDALTAINRSVVGTSKFLHFAEPEIFPIWDSVVARVFKVDNHSNAETYELYFKAVHEWLEEGCAFPENYSEAVKDFGCMSNVRKLELALFWEGQLRRPQKIRTHTLSAHAVAMRP